MRVLRTKFKRLAALAAALEVEEPPDNSPYFTAEGKAAIAPYTLIWSGDDARIAQPLQDGEHLAVDVRCTGVSDEGVSFACVERASSTPGDLGTLRDRRGDIVGYVTSIAGDVLRLEVTVQWDPPSADVARQ